MFHHHLTVALIGRCVAAAAACIAFYVALFLYEDEEGKLQNWVEQLWVSIDDRANSTRSYTTAILNTIANVLTGLFTKIFGKRFVSTQVVLVSLFLSLAGFCISGVVINDGGPIFFIPAAIYLLCALLAVRFQKLWVRAVLSVPLILSLFGFESFVHFLLVDWAWQNTTFTVVALLLWSVASDVLSVVLVRRSLLRISNSPTVSGTFGALLMLFGGVTLVAFAPYMLGAYLSQSGNFIKFPFSTQIIRSTEGFFAIAASFLNTISAVYLSLPFLLLVAILLHRVMWPILARLLYPSSQRRMLVNRKTMLALGCLLMTFAFNLERVGLKAVLKLFSAE